MTGHWYTQPNEQLIFSVPYALSLALLIFCGALASCENNSTQTNSGELEILETWSNGKVKKDRLQLIGDTSRITTYHDNFKVHMVGEVVLRRC